MRKFNVGDCIFVYVDGETTAYHFWLDISITESELYDIEVLKDKEIWNIEVIQPYPYVSNPYHSVYGSWCKQNPISKHVLKEKELFYYLCGNKEKKELYGCLFVCAEPLAEKTKQDFSLYEMEEELKIPSVYEFIDEHGYVPVKKEDFFGEEPFLKHVKTCLVTDKKESQMNEIFNFWLKK